MALGDRIIEGAYVHAYLTFGTHPPTSVEQLQIALAAIPPTNIAAP
jgi:hypothetical protein